MFYYVPLYLYISVLKTVVLVVFQAEAGNSSRCLSVKHCMAHVCTFGQHITGNIWEWLSILIIKLDLVQSVASSMTVWIKGIWWTGSLVSHWLGGVVQIMQMLQRDIYADYWRVTSGTDNIWKWRQVVKEQAELKWLNETYFQVISRWTPIISSMALCLWLGGAANAYRAGAGLVLPADVWGSAENRVTGNISIFLSNGSKVKGWHLVQHFQYLIIFCHWRNVL